MEVLTIAFIATMVLIGGKFGLSIFLGLKVREKFRATGVKRLDFLVSTLFLILGLAVSRSLYSYYDFFMTEFNPDLLWRTPNVYVWQVATFIGGLMGVIVLFVVERDIYKFKFKLIPTAFTFVVSLIQLLYPIKSQADFLFVSNLGPIGMISSLIVVITFLYLAIKSSGELRRVSVVLVVALVGYALVSMLMSESILNALDDALGIRVGIIIFVPIAKLVFLSMCAYGATKFQI